MITIEKEDIGTRVKNAWNVFLGRNDIASPFIMGDYTNPGKKKFRRGNEKSIVTSVYNRIAIDCSAHRIHHVRLNSDDQYLETINSDFNKAITESANLDQTGKAFMQDVIMSLFDNGSVAVVPVDTSVDPSSGSYDIQTLRVGEVVEWFPSHVRVRLYNEKNGKKQKLVLPKTQVALIENPLYAIMNEPNSVLQRLIRKLNLLDAVDEQSGKGKMDLILQMPYSIKTEARESQARKRTQQLEDQLRDSTYGIGYIDGTERVTQLNRPIENNLMKQVEYLTSMFWNQLGMTQGVFDGTASEAEMLNYNNRTIGPVMDAVAEEFKRKFLTKTAITQKQSVEWFVEPFKLVTADKLAELADKFTRNEIMSSNEFRSVIGMKPSDDPKADELRNKNLNQTPGEGAPPTEEGGEPAASEYDTGYEEGYKDGVEDAKGNGENVEENNEGTEE